MKNQKNNSSPHSKSTDDVLQFHKKKNISTECIFPKLLIKFSECQSLSNYWASNFLKFCHTFTIAFYRVWTEANEMASETVEIKVLIMHFLCLLRSRLGWDCWRSDATKTLTLPDIAKNFWKGFCSFNGVAKEWAISSEERLENSVTAGAYHLICSWSQ